MSRDDETSGDYWKGSRVAKKWREKRRVKITDLTAEVARLRAEVERLRLLLEDVRISGVSFDDHRIGYVEVQIGRRTWNEIRALAGGEGT